MLHVGDVVIRKSYGGDIVFRIEEILSNRIVKLVGINYRIVADASWDDLQMVHGNQAAHHEKAKLHQAEKNTQKIIKDRNKKTLKRAFRSESVLKKPGRVLHVDGDSLYLKLCVKYYKELGIDIVGQVLSEKEQPLKIKQLLEEYRPDILVLTGHDSIAKEVTDLKDIKNYRSSEFFVEAVKKARQFEPNLDNLIIFAGACQSYYEALIEAGANFASSPERVMIHALDPVFIVEKIAFASVQTILGIDEILENTITGLKGLGGLQTRGKYREGAPAYQ